MLSSLLFLLFGREPIAYLLPIVSGRYIITQVSLAADRWIDITETHVTLKMVVELSGYIKWISGSVLILVRVLSH